MGFLRNSGFILISIILFCLLVVIGTFLTISYSLEYDTLEPNLNNAVQEFLNAEVDIGGIINQSGDNLFDYCSAHNIFSYESRKGEIKIPCSIIENGFENVVAFFVADSRFSEGLDITTQKELSGNYKSMLDYCSAHDYYFFREPVFSYESNIDCNKFLSKEASLVELAVGGFIYEIYYQDYDCGFFDCFSKTGSIFFLISQHSADYFKAKVSLFSLIALICIGILLVLAEKRSMVLIVSGALLILASFFIRIFINTLLSLGLNKFINFQEMNFDINVFFKLFFTQLSFVSTLFISI